MYTKKETPCFIILCISLLQLFTIFIKLFYSLLFSVRSHRKHPYGKKIKMANDMRLCYRVVFSLFSVMALERRCHTVVMSLRLFIKNLICMYACICICTDKLQILVINCIVDSKHLFFTLSFHID